MTINDQSLGERSYHEQHFFCCECGDPFLEPGAQAEETNAFTVYRGHPYCERCHLRLHKPKCRACNLPIADGALVALGKKYHPGCFKCSVRAPCGIRADAAMQPPTKRALLSSRQPRALYDLFPDHVNYVCFHTIMSTKELYKLELLSLVSRVAQELYNHTKLQDKNLAEFVIAVHEQSKTLDVFTTKLADIGADFPEWFVKNLDRLILTMHPKYKRKDKKAPVKAAEARKFPGLSVPDQEWKASDEYEADAEPLPPSLLAERSRPAADFGDGPEAKRPRREERRGPDDRPVLYKIYDGTVTNVRDFGAFVLLDGVAGRTEGMIHVSNLAGSRVGSATEILSRNQRVKVKVMTVAGTKYGLSLKDVDQRTGADQSYVAIGKADVRPHLYIKSAEELAIEERRTFARGSNAMPLRSEPIRVEERKAKRLSSPERFEIKQLIASGAVSAAEVSLLWTS